MATLTEYRRFIIERLNDETMPARPGPDGRLPRRHSDAAGSPLSGPQYNRAIAIIETAIPDPVEQNKLRGHMCMLSKFQFMDLLTNPTNPLVKSNAAVVERICAAVLDDEMAHHRNHKTGMAEI